jgi:hypothetical protein
MGPRWFFLFNRPPRSNGHYIRLPNETLLPFMLKDSLKVPSVTPSSRCTRKHLVFHRCPAPFPNRIFSAMHRL